MIRATLTMIVLNGKDGEFEAAWRAVAERVRHEPGVLRQSLLRDPDEPRTFVVSSDWESREAFGRFERSPEQDELTAPLRSLREAAQMTVYEIVEHVDS
jgi:quinol monooxygenase YgiN